MQEQIYNFIVQCPICNSEFNLYSALSDKIKEQIQDQFRKELEKQKEIEIQRIKDSLNDEYKNKILEEIEKHKRERQELENDIKNRELELQLQLEKQKYEFDLEIKQIQEESKLRLEQLLREQELLKKQKEELFKENEQRQKEMEEVHQLELKLRQRESEIFMKEKNLELEVQRKLSQEMEKTEELIRKKFLEEFQMTLTQKDKTISDMQKKIEELNFKIQQGSQQQQGEIQEIVLEKVLREKFPLDHIQPVPIGVRGADVIQEVYNKFGELCGKIVWESKRTSSWSNDWIPKLKDDRDEINAEIAVIVSRALPKEIKSVGLMDGIWVSDFASFIGLAMALRENLLQINHLKNSLSGKETKMEQIYNYICSEQFANKISAIVASFKNMRNDLEKERMAMEKHWRKREEELNKMIKHTARIYGELEALAGNQLPDVKLLELPSGGE
ncbi:MAG: DUF2130 domain-containing protein [Candidatus Kapaibacteriales bacterium]